METIIWKEEILPIIFYITSELNLSVEYKIERNQTTRLPKLQPMISIIIPIQDVFLQ
jgi:hypothetical protein